MIANEICEALYALPGGVVAPRRRPICKPLCLALLGAVLLIVNFVAVTDKSGALSMSLMVLGIALFAYGAIVTIVRLSSDDRVPYHLPSKRHMRYSERYYSREQLADVQRALASGDAKAIAALPTGNVSAITVVGYHAADGSIDAFAAYEYVAFDSKIIGEVYMMTKN